MDAVLGQGGSRRLLADDMGLGKTATALAHLVERPGPHLVICPLSVVHNWEAESHRFTPGQTVVVHHGAGRHQTEPALFGLADADIVITTYGCCHAISRRSPRSSGTPWCSTRPRW